MHKKIAGETIQMIPKDGRFLQEQLAMCPVYERGEIPPSVSSHGNPE